MNSRCHEIQETLAADGPRALQHDADARRHLAECDACFRFLESLTEIDAGFDAMAQFDAPDEVVDALLARPEIVAGPKRSFAARLLRPRPLVWGSLAASFLIVALAVGLRFGEPEFASRLVAQKDAARESSVPEIESLEAGGDDVQRLEGAEQSLSKVDDRRDKNEADARFRDNYIADLPVPGREYQNVLPMAPGVQDPVGSRSRDAKAKVNPNTIEEMELITGRAGIELDEENKRPPARKPPPPRPAARPAPAPAPILAGVAGVTTPVLIADSRVIPNYPESARAARIEAQVVLQVVVDSNGTVTTAETLKCDRPNMGFEQAAIDAVLQWRFAPAMRNGVAVDVYWTITIDFELDPDNSSLLPDEATRSAREFLARNRALENLTYKSATGYWSNTYVPGDPAMRLLESRLAGQDRPAQARLHDAARQVGQPFDTPNASALAVYLQADRRGHRRGQTESGRMLVQVGLEGTPRHGGRRPAMNVALVLDLREEIDAEVAIGVRALLEAFNRAQEPGDAFRVFVAGRPGGCVVAPDDFRHGYLKVTLDRLLAAPREGLDLVGAVSSAIETIAAVDDPDAPLGSNTVVLVSGSPFGDAARSLANLAHQGAVAGVPLSVIGVGNDVALDEIDRVTLAGQGNRRLLDNPAAATQLVDRELSAAGRAIARAVRLRIRLAPGVKLVDVLGSERLDETRAQRVRQAERSIDLRLAHGLGIEADRGEDEEGIQIVLPSFYAGDSHVILLDVVAPGPGPIADITVRYKDLVHLRNGLSRASLSLGRDTRAAGPLERNVLKNRLSFELSETLEQSGLALTNGDRAFAASLLQDFACLLDGLRRELPGFDTDPDVLRDIAMLDEYRTLLASGFAEQPGGRAYLADSLRYAARLKVLPRPLETLS